MCCTDTDSKGKAIFQTKSGAYFGLTPDEMLEALDVIGETLLYREDNGERKFIDSQHKKNY